MHFRWTMKQLREYSDDRVLRALINERMHGLNPYTPLARRLQKIGAALDAQMQENAAPKPTADHTPALLAALRECCATLGELRDRDCPFGPGDVPEWDEGGKAYETVHRARAAIRAAEGAPEGRETADGGAV